MQVSVPFDSGRRTSNLNGAPRKVASVLGMDRAAVACGATLVYSDLRPAQLRVLAPGESSFSTVSLGNSLTLPEYLQSRRFKVQTSDQPEQTPLIAKLHDINEWRYQEQMLYPDDKAQKQQFGRCFEAAVAWRVSELLHRLGNEKFLAVVPDIWYGVKVATTENPGETWAEYDVLLLLSNATVNPHRVQDGQIG